MSDGPFATGRYDPDELPFGEMHFVYFASYMTRAVMLNEVGYESCILTSKLISELFRRLGITCMPITLGVDAFNKAAWERVQRGEKVSDHTDPEDDAYVCRIPHDPERHSEEALQGHLAVVVRNRYLVDASIDQLSRPARDLYIEPVILTFGTDEDSVTFEDFIGGEAAHCLLPNGGALIYHPHPEDLEYQSGVDFQPIDTDAKSQHVLDSVYGLVEVALDSGEFPPLPPLPTSISTHYGRVIDAIRENGLTAEDAQEVIARHGFTLDEYVSQIDAVSSRVQRRQAANA